MIAKHVDYGMGHYFRFSPNDITIMYPVGHFALHVSSSKHFHLESVRISTSLQGRGFGKQMVVDAVHEARRLGAKILTLWVFPSNKAAIHIYELAGFKQAPRDDYDGRLTYMKMEV